MSIPVICDRCRATGTAGQGDFSHLGDLLDFEPVPVRQRVNGWDPDAQRAFIALLASTGSKRRAALAIGRNAYGMDQLLKRPGSTSLRIAYDRAKAIAKANGSMKIAQGVADAAARNAQLAPPSRLRGAEPEPDPGISDDHKLEVIENIVRKYLGKVRMEREERLAGNIVAADFYLRQITFIEIGLDLAATEMSISAFDLLASFRRDGHGWIRIAETPFSAALDEQRRKLWAAAGEPERPEHPPRRFLQHLFDYNLEPSRAHVGATTAPAAGYSEEQWSEMSAETQRQARRDELAAEAEAQIAWEAKAQADFLTRQGEQA